MIKLRNKKKRHKDQEMDGASSKVGTRLSKIKARERMKYDENWE